MVRPSQRIKQQQQRNKNGSVAPGIGGSSSNLPYRTKSNNEAGGSMKTTIIRLFMLIVLVVVGAGIVSFSQPLQSCLLLGQDVLMSVQSQVNSTTTSESSSLSPPLMWDSTNATVMAYATGYHINNYKRFVGSLRNSGFNGHIILAVAPDMPVETENYLKSRRVTYHKVQFVDCTNEIMKENEIRNSHDHEVRRCMAPYADLKARWGRYPLLRDYLQQCTACTGPVLVTDLRDTLFQRDPFGSGDPAPTGLQVFQEHSALRTDNWIVDYFIEICKGKNDPFLGRKLPMLCSGTTIGTRQAMLDYLAIMHGEMKLWMKKRTCHIKTSADDQSIHNYLYYTGQLPFAKSVPNRMGIVHTIGFEAAKLHQYNEQFRKEHANDTDEQLNSVAPLRIIHNKNQPWLAPQLFLTDHEGYVLDFDGNRSRVVHQYDRFGHYMDIWFSQFSGLVDK